MALELGTELRAESVTLCHTRFPDSRESFIQCLCENVAGLCRAPQTQSTPTAVTATTPTGTTSPHPTGPTAVPPFVPTDWTRSYSVTAGLCALFLAMCAVIIVLRIMSKRNDPQARNRVSVSTVPVPDSDPPPYDVVVRLPPSYISREPPPYCEIDVDKYPSPLICPRMPLTVIAGPAVPDTSTIPETFTAADTFTPADTCNVESCAVERPVPAAAVESADRDRAESASRDVEAGSTCPVPASTGAGGASGAGGADTEAQSELTEVVVNSEVGDVRATASEVSEAASR